MLMNLYQLLPMNHIKYESMVKNKYFLFHIWTYASLSNEAKHASMVEVVNSQVFKPACFPTNNYFLVLFLSLWNLSVHWLLFWSLQNDKHTCILIFSLNAYAHLSYISLIIMVLSERSFLRLQTKHNLGLIVAKNSTILLWQQT